MTAPARISQADYDKATKSAAQALARPEVRQARVVAHLPSQTIEIILGSDALAPVQAPAPVNPWDAE